MSGKRFLRDESGAVTVDWFVLTAGILLLGLILVISVMENSSGYLMDEFESLNEKYAEDSVTLSEMNENSSFGN